MEWIDVARIVVWIAATCFIALCGFVAGFSKGYDAGVEDRGRYDDQA